MPVLKALTGRSGTVPRRIFWWSAGVVSVAQIWLYFFSQTPNFGDYGPTVVWGLGALPLTYLWLLVAAARSRDAGKSGAMALLTLIPVVGLWAVVWLGCESSVSPDQGTVDV